MSDHPGAYAVVRWEVPEVIFAEDENVLSKVLAYRVVAQLPSEKVSSEGRLKQIRSALMEERWGEALSAWITETGVAVDVYPSPPSVWLNSQVETHLVGLELQLSPLFQ